MTAAVVTCCAMIAQAPLPARATAIPTAAPARLPVIQHVSRARQLISRVSRALWVIPREVMKKLNDSAMNSGFTSGSR